MAPSKLRFEEVSKSFGAVRVLESVTLDVADGEFLVLLGPSGCGKTTLLRMTAGLEEASSGSIWLDGRRIDDLPPKDRDIAMVFQSYALYPHMTVEQNIGYPLKIRKTPAGELAEKTAAVARQLGLTHLLARRPKELSGGQRQRVALGRAIIRHPGVFLMDEPLSNLDAQLRIQMRAEIKGLQRELGVTTLYVTHDQVEAMSMASRIAVFKDGALRQVGTPEAVYARPADLFVAGFIGSPPMNFLNGVAGPEGVVFQSEEGPYRLPRRLRAGPVVMGARPQDLRFAAQGLSAKVFVTEPLGDEHHVIVQAGEHRLTVKCAADPGFVPGESRALAFDEAKLHFFDPVTGLRLTEEETR